jgi:hypothetical protein
MPGVLSEMRGKYGLVAVPAPKRWYDIACSRQFDDTIRRDTAD